jgi:hypothetical protein
MSLDAVAVGGDRDVARARPRARSGVRWLARAAAAALVLAAAGLLAMRHLEQDGRAFFETGRAVDEGLGRFAQAFQEADAAGLRAGHADDYEGAPLGLGARQPADERDGVRRLRLGGASVGSGTAAVPAVLDAAGAVSEWVAFRRGFRSVVEARFHLDRIARWDPDREVRATAILEVIGTPVGEPRSTVDRATLRVRLVPSASGWRLAQAELLEGERIAADRPLFSDVAPSAGVDFENRVYPPFLNQRMAFGVIRYGPAGITAADFDNDGWPDLFVPDGVHSRLFRNRADGSFEDVTAAAGLAGLDGVSVALFADYDNDGWKDLFVSRTFRPNQLFHSEGRGPDGIVTFRDVTAGSGLGEDCCTTVASWADYDHDGRLDLYVGRYLDPRSRIPTTFYARNGEPNQLYHNEGGGRFTNVTARAGVAEPGLCLGTAFGDYDDDGWPDLYVSNDFGRKTLYRNNRDGTFTDVTVKTGTLAYGAGMSASWGDYDNDGRLDLYAAQIRSDFLWFAEAPTIRRYMANSFRQGVWRTDMPLYFEMFRQSGPDITGIFRQMASGNTLLRNRGDGTFEDVSWPARANPPGWFWGSSFADFDNDGWQDIYSANGWVKNDLGTEMELEFLNNVVSRQAEYKTGVFFDPDTFGRTSWHGWERNRHLRNNRDGTFLEIGHAAGTDLLLNSRGIAVADFWNRGRLDLAVAASTERHALLRNELEVSDGEHNWLAVDLVGTHSNRDAVGARVTVTAQGLRQVREVALGDGYGSQNSLRLHFGLGSRERVETLTVWWPRSRTTQRFEHVEVNRVIEVTEGRDRLVVHPAPRGGMARLAR